jgi:hypothetical protein
MLVKLTPQDPVKDPVLVQIDSMKELSRRVREIGAVKVETIRCVYIFREAY